MSIDGFFCGNLSRSIIDPDRVKKLTCDRLIRSIHSLVTSTPRSFDFFRVKILRKKNIIHFFIVFKLIELLKLFKKKIHTQGAETETFGLSCFEFN